MFFCYSVKGADLLLFTKATNGSDYNTFRAGAKPHGQMDEVMPPKKLVSTLPTFNQEPTLSARIGSGASPSGG
ncbi:MAG: hypothetical protein IJH67_07245 [Thermoguttaceae bacterium]|nr:hypothetical protein [Thermoguttaceae bacterium]